MRAPIRPIAGLALLSLTFGPSAALAQPGITATEIKVGNTNPYSGPLSAYGTIGKVIGAYFKKVSDEGGINGRKINYISYDDQYSPPKTLEMTRKLVEQDQVTLVLQPFGTPTNSATAPKFASQAIRKAYDLGWRPVQILSSVSASVQSVLKPAGVEAAKGILSAQYLKDVTDPQGKNEPGFKGWAEFMGKYHPGGSIEDAFNAYGYTVAQTLVHVLKQCGNDLSRANMMKQAASINGLALPMLLPGIRINTGPNDFFQVEQMQLGRFDGEHWVFFRDLFDASRK